MFRNSALLCIKNKLREWEVCSALSIVKIGPINGSDPGSVIYVKYRSDCA